MLKDNPMRAQVLLRMISALGIRESLTAGYWERRRLAGLHEE
jgi:hypothetical protein